MDEDHPSYQLVMPFVACRSEGGPYDDEAFVAGYRLGILDAKLHARQPTFSEPIEPLAREQCDLLAMRYGYSFEAEPDEEYPDDWLIATFTRGS